MSAVSYYLFLDSRESPAVLDEVNKAIRAWGAGRGRRYQAPFSQVSYTAPVTGWCSAAAHWGVPPLEMMSILTGIDWAYPAQVVYREEREKRWSHATLGLSLREEAA